MPEIFRRFIVFSGFRDFLLFLASSSLLLDLSISIDLDLDLKGEVEPTHTTLPSIPTLTGSTQILV